MDPAFAGGSAQPQDQQEHPAPLQAWMKYDEMGETPSLIHCQESPTVMNCLSNYHAKYVKLHMAQFHGLGY